MCLEGPYVGAFQCAAQCVEDLVVLVGRGETSESSIYTVLFLTHLYSKF